MILTSPTRVVFTYTIFRDRDDKPHNGDTYRDPRGNIWTVRHTGVQIILGGPPNTTAWSIALEAEHGAYRIEPGENLVPVRTWRNDMGWDGVVEHEEGVGFGDIIQRLPGPELSYGGTRWSWIYREVGQAWMLQVGPHVPYRADFRDAIFERTGENRQPLVDGDRWARIRPALLAFQEGED